VVASAVGGIKEVVLDEQTGLLVPFAQESTPPFEASDPERFARDLAQAINRLMQDPALASAMGQAGRRRAEEVYSWSAVAQKVRDLYLRVTSTVEDGK